MIDVSPSPTVPPRGTSILVFGTGENSMSILAAALARQAQSPFGWANCSGTTEGLESVALQLLQENSDPGRATRVDPRDLTKPPPYMGQLGHLVEPATIPPEERSRLADYLGLPLLIQRLLASAHAPEGRTILVVTNVDALPPSVTDAALARPEIHEILHREHVTLVATFRGIPPNALREAFERVYRTDSAEGARWVDAVVTMERGPGMSGMPSPAPLRELLPWLGLTTSQVGGPTSGFGHYLR